jgi:carboxymethylenebutenolidase
MSGQTIDIKATDEGRFSGYLALPASGSGPGLLLVQDVYGVDAILRAAADLFAEEGYVVLAPDLFWRLRPGLEFSDDPQGQIQARDCAQGFNRDQGVADLGDALQALRARRECQGKVAALGCGLGGLLAYLAAARLPVDAAVSFHGENLDQYPTEAAQIRCPLLFHFGGQGEHLSPDRLETVRSLFARHPDAKIHVYPEAAPGFYLSGRHAFNRSASDHAHSRTIGFLRRLLGPVYDLDALWEQHLYYEFNLIDAERTMTTMTAEPANLNVPVMTGGVGHDQVLRYYKSQFLGQLPQDARVVTISRTIGADRVVDEHLLCFTHSHPMDAMLPGVAPTGKYVELPVVVIVQFRGDKVIGEHIHWDQATLLVQVGVLDPQGLPVGGVENARKLLDEQILREALQRQKK